MHRLTNPPYFEPEDRDSRMSQPPVETNSVVAEQLPQPTTGHNAITDAEASTRHGGHAATARSTPGTSWA